MYFSFRIFLYIVRRFGLNVLLILFATSSIIALFDMIEVIRALSASQTNAFLVLKLVFFKNYNTLRKLLPFVFLIASAKTYQGLAKNYEILAMHAIGVSHFTLLFPLVVVTTFFTILHLAIFMPLSSHLIVKYEYIFLKHRKFIEAGLTDERNISEPDHRIMYYPINSGIWIKKNKMQIFDIQDDFSANVTSKVSEVLHMQESKDKKLLLKLKSSVNAFDLLKSYGVQCQGSGGTYIMKISNLDQRNKGLKDLDIFLFDEDFCFLGRLFIENLHEINRGMWFAKNLNIVDSKSHYHYLENKAFYLNFCFDDVISSLAEPHMINPWNALDFLKNARQLGFSTLEYEAFLWKMIFGTILFFCMLMLSYAFTLVIPRVRNFNFAYFKLIIFGIAIHFINMIFVILTKDSGVGLLMEILLPYALSFFISLYILLSVKKH